MVKKEHLNRQTAYLKEPGKAGIVGHVFRQVGEQDSQVEANLLRWVVEALCKLHVIDLAIMVAVTAHEQEIDLLSKKGKETKFISFLKKRRKVN